MAISKWQVLSDLVDKIGHVKNLRCLDAIIYERLHKAFSNIYNKISKMPDKTTTKMFTERTLSAIVNSIRTRKILKQKRNGNSIKAAFLYWTILAETGKLLNFEKLYKTNRWRKE